ncbi:MAG: biopolymer transporter ExbD [Gammaproteobacteria bacterium]
MKFKRNIKKPDVIIDLTSMIDIVFILLLFYMLGATFTHPNSLKITLPEANGQVTDQHDLRIELLVTRKGNYTVNGHELANNQVQTLMQSITDLAAGDTSVPVTITADADTTHQSVVTAMDAVARLGFGKLNIATRQVEAAVK